MDFTGPLWYWRGPAPHYFVTVPDDEAAELKAASRLVTYGWGMIPVHVTIGSTRWPTSLFPKDGRYIVPVRANVRQREGLEEGQDVTIHLDLRT